MSSLRFCGEHDEIFLRHLNTVAIIGGADVALQTLRSSVTIILQDLYMLSDTPPSSHDLFDIYSDEAIWAALVRSAWRCSVWQRRPAGAAQPVETRSGKRRIRLLMWH
jgi:ABC-type multidrug transport system fused ATPase/permease subunit